MSTYAVSVKNVIKKFGNQIVLNDVSVDFPKGGIYGLVGRNGSGKTMLMKCICGFVFPTHGEIRVWDKWIGREIDFPDSMGFIIETPGFLPGDSGIKNLKYLAAIRKKIKEERIKECMSLVGLDPESHKHVGKYSMGMRQRLGIAQAIMENPDLIMLDEPMNGLDNRGVEDMRKLFIKLKAEGKTILLASHNKEDIKLLCDQVYEMDAGNIRKIDTL